MGAAFHIRLSAICSEQLLTSGYYCSWRSKCSMYEKDSNIMTFGFLGQTHIKGDTCRRDVLTWVESNHMNAHGA